MSSKQNVLPIAGILSGALVWGLIWYPYRMLQDAGLSGSVAAMISYLLALLCGTFMLPRVWHELHPQNKAGQSTALQTAYGIDIKGLKPQPHTQSHAGWWLVVLVLSAGWSNFGYVLAVLNGEVMRVLLLFYLAPLWTILFSYWLLGERLNGYGYLVIALSFGGAVIMLWEPRLGLPLPQNFSEWIGLSAGMSFALSNVVSRRAAHLSVTAKSSSVLFGTALLTAPFMWWQGGLSDQLMAIGAQSWLILLLLGIVLCATSYAVQHGLSHLAANRVIILFLFELVFAAIASYFLAGEAMQLREWLGALLIISASLLSGRLHAEEAR